MTANTLPANPISKPSLFGKGSGNPRKGRWPGKTN